mgnify:CR=1
MVGEVLENGLQAELDDELGYSKYNYRNKNTKNSRKQEVCIVAPKCGIQRYTSCRLRLHYAKVVKPEFALVWDFKITYEMAKNWRKAQGAYLRQNQWKDLTVRVCLDVG